MIERYKHFTDLLKQGNREDLYKESKQDKITSEEYGLVFSRMDYQNASDWKYAIVDLNKDGQDELLIGDENLFQPFIIWKIKNLAYFTQHI